MRLKEAGWGRGRLQKADTVIGCQKIDRDGDKFGPDQYRDVVKVCGGMSMLWFVGRENFSIQGQQTRPLKKSRKPARSGPGPFDGSVWFSGPLAGAGVELGWGGPNGKSSGEGTREMCCNGMPGVGPPMP